MILRLYSKKHPLRGEITVFLALLSSVFLGLLGVMAESARLQLIRMNIEGVMDAGLRSCFGEYDRYLFKRYDLLYVDSSYRGSMPVGIDSVINHLSMYMVKNTDYSDTGTMGEWYGERITDADCVSYVLANDEGGRPLKRQAVEYIEKYGTIRYLATINGSKEQFIGIKKTDFYEEWDRILESIESYGLPLTNPGKIVRGMVLSDEEFLKNGALKGAINGDRPSLRGNGSGAGCSKIKRKNENDDLFVEYLMQKFGCYTEYTNDQKLTGELEYLVYGKETDTGNMISVVNDLMDKRLSDNLRAIKGDGGKVMAAYEKAYLIVMFNSLEIPNPALVKLVRDSIIYAWAYGESAIDVSRLLNKGKCPVIKGSADIDLSLEELLNFKSRLWESSGKGLSYKEYMGILVSAGDDGIRRLRSMDIIEGNIKTFYNSEFRVDGCVEYLRASVSFSSSYGYEHSIEREYLYE